MSVEDQLIQEVRAYLETDEAATAWVDSPHPGLDGASPRVWVQKRRAKGLREIQGPLVDTMPRRPETDLLPIDVTIV